MITGELKSQVDNVWNAFWTGGIANPLEVIEQITYLLFIKRLDDLHTAEEKKANVLKTEIANPIFNDEQQDLRWSKFKNFGDTREMYDKVATEVFPFIRQFRGDDTTYSDFMKDARLSIPTPALLSKVVDLIDEIPMRDRDTKGDVYEYRLGKIATAGQNGQFRTPRHIIKMMVEMIQPLPTDIVCDPACGTAGFLVTTSEYLHDTHREIFADPKLTHHFYNKLFNGFDFDNTMLRIGSMNMMLHGVENPNIINRWRNIDAEAGRARTNQSFFVPKAEIAANDYDLSINRYKEVVYEETNHDSPQDILRRLSELEDEIQADLKTLQTMIS